MKYILAFDQGTTSSRAVLIDHDGNIRGIAQKEFRQYFPSPAWVEHDPKEIWSTQMGVAMEVLTQHGISSKEIAAIGITNQRETTIVWDKKTGKPLTHAIVWQDRRTTEFCQKLKNEGLEEFFAKKTGLLLDPYFSGTKIKWILDHYPGSAERAKRGELAFGTIDSWLVWKLTEGKVHITDVTNASRTLLFNIHTLDWDEELLRILEIPKEMLPKIVSSSEVYAETSPTLFSSPIPIAGIAGDQQAALFGQACLKEGMAKNTYGTGCFMLLNTGNKPVYSKNKLLTTIAFKVQDRVDYALEGSVFMAGAVIQWLRDNLGVIKHSSEVEKLALSVEDNGGIVFIPAFTGLGAPYWNPYTRGTILGISRGTTSGHIARAALEAIAFQVTDVIKAMEADAKIPLSELRIDGGAIGNSYLMQFQADLLGAAVIQPQIQELTALGAGFLAGLAVGFWKNEQEIEKYWTISKKYEPNSSEKTLKHYQRWKKAIEVAQNWEDRGYE